LTQDWIKQRSSGLNQSAKLKTTLLLPLAA
jgi:hypothetical protein